MGVQQFVVNVYQASVETPSGTIRTTVKLPRIGNAIELYRTASVAACIELGCRHDDPTLRVRYAITRVEPN